MTQDADYVACPVLDKRCPKCGGDAVYNGNYYCLECDWALAERADVQPWLRSLIRARRAQGQDTSWEEQYLTSNGSVESRQSLEHSDGGGDA